jgi:hypothetical protein
VILHARGILLIHTLVHVPVSPGDRMQMRIAIRAEISHLQFHL